LILSGDGKIRYTKDNKLIVFCILFFVIDNIILNFIQIYSQSIITIVIMIPMLFYMNSSEKIDLYRINRIIDFFWLYAVLYEAMQIFLYLLVGRLPALAYATGVIYDVRFGGPWDDPNAFAILLTLYFPYIIMKYQKWQRTLRIGITAGMLLLTWSGTGILTFVVTMILVMMINLGNRKLMNRYVKIIVAVVIVAFLILIMFYDQLKTFIINFMLMKQGSIAGHMEGWDMTGIGILTYLGIVPSSQNVEPGIVRILGYGGVPALVIFLGIGLCSISKLNKRLKEMENKNDNAIIYGMIAYQIAFLVSMLNMAFHQHFACIGVFSCIVIVSCVGQKSDNCQGISR
jgi:hypothetical protein